MTFVHLMMLFGGLAFAVPLLLHLLHRRKHQLIDWGAMHLLESIIQDNRRRWRVQEWLLLLVRCLIPILLALCLARPMLTSWSSFYGQADPAIVFILDDSASMSRELSDGRTYWQATVDACQEIIDGYDVATNVQIILSGRQPLVLPQGDSIESQLSTILSSRESVAGPTSPVDAMKEALEIVSRWSPTPAFVVVISDFQNEQWKDPTSTAMQNLLQSYPDLLPRPQWLFLRPGDSRSQESTPTPNIIALEQFQLNPATALVGDSVAATMVVRNLAAQPLDNVEMRVVVNGEAIDVRSLPLPANNQVELNFQLPSGKLTSDYRSVAVTAETRYQDGWAADNSRSVVFECVPSTRVAVLSSSEAKVPNQQEKNFLSYAISPFAFAAKEQGVSDSFRDRFNALLMLPQDWPQADWELFDCVVIADCGDLTVPLADKLKDYVVKGGAVLSFCGPKLLQNAQLFKSNRNSQRHELIPMDLRKEAANPIQNLSDASAMRISQLRFEHASLSIFNDAKSGTLALAEFRQWIPFDKATFPKNGSILAQFSNGDVFACEVPLGNGSVITVSTTATTEWNSFPLQPTYLPFVQETLKYLVDRSSTLLEVDSGNVALVPLPVLNDDVTLEVKGPNGESHAFTTEKKDDRSWIRVPETREVGVYHILTIDSPKQYVAFFVSLQSDAERIPGLLTDLELQEIANSIQGRLIGQVSEFHAFAKDQMQGSEIWFYFWCAIIVLLVMERWIIGWIRRVVP